MTQFPQRDQLSGPAATKSPAVALVIWTACQLALLAAIWADLRISANPIHTAGQIGTQLLLAGQLIFSAALLADIARTTQLAAASFAIAFPITQLAGWKCDAAASASLLASAVLLLWLAGLLCWMQVARSARSRHLIAAAIMLWTAGTPLLWYILAEFAPGGAIQWLIAATSPVMLTGRTPQLLLVTALQAAAAAGAVVVLRRRWPTL